MNDFFEVLNKLGILYSNKYTYGYNKKGLEQNVQDPCFNVVVVTEPFTSLYASIFPFG